LRRNPHLTGPIAGLPAWMADPAACSSIEVGKVMASAEALTELRGLMDSVASHVGAPLEKMPVEAHHDQQEAGCADEPAAVPNPASRTARKQPSPSSIFSHSGGQQPGEPAATVRSGRPSSPTRLQTTGSILPERYRHVL